MATGRSNYQFTANTSQATQQLRQLEKVAQDALGQVQQLQNELNQVGIKGRNLGSQLNTLRQGLTGRDATLRNTQQQAQSAQIRSQSGAIGAAGTQQQATLMDRMVKSARELNRLQEASRRTSLRSWDVTRDTNKLYYQRVEAARRVNVAREQGLDTLNKELDRFNKIDSRYKELIANEERLQKEAKETARVQQQRARAMDPDNIAFQQQTKNARNRFEMNDPEAQRLMAERGAQARRSLTTGVGAASLFEVQTQLFAQFSVLFGAFQGLRFISNFVVQLDRAMRDLQAITDSTNQEMFQLRDTLIEVSEATKFTAVEVAEASRVLGQAGFSTQEIENSIESVTLLATATGSQLSEAVDVVTSAISTFNLQTTEASRVANLFTAAINNSKLSLDKLALGIQYASNIAAQSGATLTELTTALAAFANSGIRRGSTLGTGLRQLLTDLIEPSNELLDKLNNLGLTTDDISVKTQGLVGVFRNLKDAGFTVADAMQSFEVRAAAAFAAITRDLDSLENLQQEILLTNAAVDANVKQMESLANTAAKFQSVVGTLAANLGRDVVRSLKRFLDALADIGAGMNDLGAQTQNLVGNLTVAAALGGISTAALSVVANLGFVRKTIEAFGKASKAAAGGALTLRGALAGLAAVLRRLLPFLAITTGFTVLFEQFGFGRDRAKALNDELQRTQTRLNEAQGEADEAYKQFSSLNDAMNNLTERSERLRNNSNELQTAIIEMENRFGSLGLVVDENTATFDALIQKIQELQRQSAIDLQVRLQTTGVELDRKGELLDREFQNITGRSRASLARNLGFDPNEVLTSETRQTGNTIKAGPGGQEVPEVRRFFTGVREGALPPAIEQGFQLLTGSRDNVTQSSLSDALSRLRGLRSDTEDQQQLNRIDKLINQLVEVAQNLREQTANDRAQQRNVRRGDKAEFLESDQFQFLQGVFGELTQKINKFSSDLASTNSITEKERIRAEQLPEIRDLYQEYIDRVNRVSPDQQEAFRKSSYFQDATAKLSEITQLDSEVDQQIRELRERALKQTLRSVEAQIDEVSAGIDSDSSASELREARERFEELSGKRIDAAAELFRLENYDLSQDDPKEFNSQLKEHLDQFRDDRARFLKKIEDNLGDIAEFTTDFGDTIAEDLERELKAAKGRLDRRVSQAQDPVEIQRSRIEGLQGPNSNAPESLITQEENKLAGLEKTALSEQVSAQRDYISTLSRLQDQYQKDVVEPAREAYEEAKTRLKQAQDQGLGRGVLNERDRDLRDATKELTSVKRTQLQIEQELSEAQDQQVRNAAQLNALNEEYNGTLTDVLKMSAQTWAEAEGMNDSFAQRMDRNFKQVFSSVKAEAGDMFSSFVKGSQSAGDAFKAFAVNVIESMADIAAQAVATNMLNFLIGGISSGFSSGTAGVGGGGTTSSGADLAIPSGGSTNSGGNSFFGFEFNSGGLVPGRDRGSDSVNARLRPGEFVMQNSAVNEVGTEFMKAVNRGKVPVMPSNQQNNGMVNVYVVKEQDRPVPGPQDIVATINDDIMRSGKTKTLIKQVSMNRM